MRGDETAAQSPYAQAMAQGQDALRRALLDAASRLLTEKGPQALSMRLIAQEVGCSTTVLYTVFKNKQRLANALYLEGFERLQHVLDSVTQTDEPLADLAALGHAYRTNAQEHPNYYGIMFGRPIPEFDPTPESRARAAESLQILTDAARRCIDAGIFRDTDPAEVTEALWAAVHGAVSLELSGYFPDRATADRCFLNVARAAGRWFLAVPTSEGDR